jgi:hypothetical protein
MTKAKPEPGRLGRSANRQQRRAAKKRNRRVVFIDYGYLLEGDKNFGLPVVCFACDAPHRAFGLARVRRGARQQVLPLCARCLADEDAVARKPERPPARNRRRR